MKGEELFAHMCKIRNSRTPAVSAHLNVDMTETQRSIIQPTDTDLLLGSIVRESNLGGSNRKLPQRRMNTIGEINSRCVVGNSTDRNRKLKEVMMLAKSLETVNRSQQVSKSNKEADEMKENEGDACEGAGGDRKVHHQRLRFVETHHSRARHNFEGQG